MKTWNQIEAGRRCLHRPLSCLMPVIVKFLMALRLMIWPGIHRSREVLEASQNNNTIVCLIGTNRVTTNSTHSSLRLFERNTSLDKRSWMVGIDVWSCFYCSCCRQRWYLSAVVIVNLNPFWGILRNHEKYGGKSWLESFGRSKVFIQKLLKKSKWGITSNHNLPNHSHSLLDRNRRSRNHRNLQNRGIRSRRSLHNYSRHGRGHRSSSEAHSNLKEF